MIKTYYEVEKFGKKYSTTGKIKSKSFLVAFTSRLYVGMFGSTVTTNKVAGTSDTMSGYGWIYDGFYNNMMAYNSSLGVVILSGTNGIVIGSGTSAVTPTQYALATQIVAGITAGTMMYYPQWFTKYTISGSTCSFIMERIFKNLSGGTITVNELGIYEIVNNTNFCMLRDKLAVGVAVLNTEYLKVKYTISVTC